MSPNLDQIAYLTTDVANNSDEVHVVSAAGHAIVATLPNPHLGRCGSPEDSRSGEYTLSGNALYVLDQPAARNSLAIVKDMTTRLQLIPQGNWPLGTQSEMALWSPTTETLYYRNNGDVWKWTASGGGD